MKKTDLIFIGVLLIGGLWVLILFKPVKGFNEISPEELLYEMNLDERYFTTDEVAKFIIEKDPEILLVDLRTEDEYEYYTLPGALNIPFDSIFNPNFEMFFNQDVYKVVFFSNGTSMADQAWLLTKRVGYSNIFVMEGGLNYWFQTIIRPIKPEEKASPDEFAKYSFRKGASMFFGGGSSDGEGSATDMSLDFQVQQRATDSNLGGCE